MLYAITHNKSGRIVVGEKKIPVRQIFREREDMLTATLFSRLPYLSSIALHQLLSSLMPTTELRFEKLKDIDFWPRFDSMIQDQVEPDVLLHFDWGTLVVEVKRPKDGVQCSEQWYRELECLPDEYTEGTVVFWALGGDSQHNQTMQAEFKHRLAADELIAFDPILLEADWKRFGKVVYEMVTESGSKLLRTDVAVLNDLLGALQLYRVDYRELHLNELIKLIYSAFGDINAISALPLLKPQNTTTKPDICWQRLATANLCIKHPLQAISKLGSRDSEE